MSTVLLTIAKLLDIALRAVDTEYWFNCNNDCKLSGRKIVILQHSILCLKSFVATNKNSLRLTTRRNDRKEIVHRRQNLVIILLTTNLTPEYKWKLFELKDSFPCLNLVIILVVKNFRF